MIPILGERGRAALSRLTAAHVLLAFDFDGTLAPIVEDRAQARMRPETRALLEALAVRYPCASVSGRAREDVARRLGGIGMACIVGNHGAEWEEPSTTASPTNIPRHDIGAWASLLSRRLDSRSGVELEHKGASLAIHYRGSADHAVARESIDRAVADLAGARVVRGNCVVDLLPTDAPDKGQAVDRLRRDLRCDAVLYVGDDTTDEPAFSLAAPRGAVGVRVGVTNASSARYFVRDQSEVDALLVLLLTLRRSRSTLAAIRRGEKAREG